VQRKNLWGGLTLAGLVVGASCYFVNIERDGLMTSHPLVATSQGASSRRSMTPAPTDRRRRQLVTPALPESATAVADSYASAAFDASAGEPDDAWVAEVAPICTTRWLALLERAANDVVVASVSTDYRVVRTFPSGAPTGDVAATVLLADGEDEASIYVVLVRAHGRFLVELAQ
jgi:hypothetical protein